MSFITDRDLLVREPSLFTIAGAAATILAGGSDGVVSGTSLASAATDFASLGIDERHVVVINGKPGEIVSRVADTQLMVSLPRAFADDPLIGPGNGSGLSFQVPSFQRLINEAERWALSLLSVEAMESQQAVTLDRVVNVEDMKSLVAMRAITDALASAAAMNPGSESLAALAALSAKRFSAAKERTSIQIDLNGDGEPDAMRYG